MNLSYHPAAPGPERLGCLTFLFLQDRLSFPADLPAPWREAMERASALGEFTGKSAQTTLLLPGAGTAERLLLVGLGKPEKLER